MPTSVHRPRGDVTIRSRQESTPAPTLLLPARRLGHMTAPPREKQENSPIDPIPAAHAVRSTGVWTGGPWRKCFMHDLRADVITELNEDRSYDAAPHWADSGRVIVLANREPFSHEHGPDGEIVVKRSTSGLVTASEQLVRQSAGVWIAHGSGTADRLVVDAWNGVMVPPENPAYRLRRVWLDTDEEDGYYYG